MRNSRFRCEPCFVGLPSPITVRQAPSDGCGSARAASMDRLSACNRSSVLQDACLVLGQRAEDGLKGADHTLCSLTLLDEKTTRPSPYMLETALRRFAAKSRKL